MNKYISRAVTPDSYFLKCAIQHQLSSFVEIIKTDDKGAYIACYVTAEHAEKVLEALNG